jgi:hypothetical protein
MRYCVINSCQKDKRITLFFDCVKVKAFIGYVTDGVEALY